MPSVELMETGLNGMLIKAYDVTLSWRLVMTSLWQVWHESRPRWKARSSQSTMRVESSHDDDFQRTCSLSPDSIADRRSRPCTNKTIVSNLHTDLYTVDNPFYAVVAGRIRKTSHPTRRKWRKDKLNRRKCFIKQWRHTWS